MADITITANVIAGATVVANVQSDGSISANVVTGVPFVSGDLSDAVILAPGSSARNVVQSTGDFIELVLKAFAGQTAAVLLIEDENGDVKWVANQDGTGQLPIGKFTPNGFGPGRPTLFDPASTNWYDGLFASFDFEGQPGGSFVWGVGPGNHSPYTGGSGQAFLQADAFPGTGSDTVGGSVGTTANADDASQFCEAYEAADIAHDGATWRAQVLVDGSESGFARLDYTQDHAQVEVRARTGQTDPLLDLKNESGTTVCSVDPVLGLGLSHLFSRDADAAVGVGEHRWYAERDITITHVLTSAGEAPVGADLIFDLILDGGSSIYTTTANRPKVAAGAHVLDQPAPDNPTILAGHYITVDTVQVGSTNAGSKIDLRVFYR